MREHEIEVVPRSRVPFEDVRMRGPAWKACGPRVEHKNSTAVLVRNVAHEGADVTDVVQATFDRIDGPAA